MKIDPPNTSDKNVDHDSSGTMNDFGYSWGFLAMGLKTTLGWSKSAILIYFGIEIFNVVVDKTIIVIMMICSPSSPFLRPQKV